MHTTIAALAVAASLVAGAASAAPVHVGFSGLPTASGPSLTYEDVTITGSDTVYNLYLNGLGIGNSAVNNGEFITFTFAELATDVSVLINVAGGGSADATAGARTVEVFGLGGNLLGSASQALTGSFDISAIGGGAALSYFTMTAADTTSFRIGSLTYTPTAPTPIPLPAAAPLLLAAIGGLAVVRRRVRPSA